MSQIRYLLALVTIAGGAACAADLTRGMELEQKVIEARRAITHGRVALTVVTNMRGPLEAAAETTRYEIEFDGDRFRLECPSWEVRRIVTPELVISGEKDGITTLRPELAVAAARDDVFHPNILGLAIDLVAAFDNYTMEQVLAHSDRTDETITEETLDDIKVEHVSYHRLVGSDIDTYIAVDQGYAVVKREAEGGEIHDILESKYSRLDSGIWYPRETTWTRYKNGTPTEQEHVTVELADFEYRPGDDRFTLASFDVPIGTVIRDNGVRKIWNGERLQTPQEARHEELVDVAAGTGRQMRLLITAATLAILAIALALWRKQRNA